MSTALWWLLAIGVGTFGLVVFRGAPYVPSHKKQLKLAFESLYTLSSKDVLVDLGSGDGIVLAQASHYGSRAVGYELNPLLWLFAKWRFRSNARVRVILGDYRRVSTLPTGTTVVYAFTSGNNIINIEHKLVQWSRNKDLYFISYGFNITGKKEQAKVGAMYLYHFPSQT